MHHLQLPIDFPPVFHIKLRDHVLLEGDPVTLSCLPAGSPHPRITWMKGRKANKCCILAFDDEFAHKNLSGTKCLLN